MGSSLVINGINIAYFAKIPFAAPPIGPLRFKYPQEIKGQAWRGVYNSTIQPNTCWQSEAGDFDKLNSAAGMWISKTEMSEDCLYLTIWAPQTTTEKLAVMVWIYGGSFFSGSSTLEVYDGSLLAARQNVIVVSLQYRLGPLGFLYMDDNLAPGNQGLMDQRMALKWVKNNIEKFNGNSDQITIFGESAGSASVSFHVLSPESSKLFNRAIMESATGLSPWSIETKSDSKKKAIELAKIVNCGNNTSRMDILSTCLLGVDPSLLTNSQFNLKTLETTERVKMLQQRNVPQTITDGTYFIDFYFRPIYDDFFIPKDVTDLLSQQHRTNNIDLLMGFNENEGMYFLLYGLNKWLNFMKNGQFILTDLLSPGNINSFDPSTFLLENILNPKHAFKSLIPLFMYEYNIPSRMIGDKQWTDLQVLAAFDQLTGDDMFVCPVIMYANAMTDNRQNVYLYKFQHRTNNVTFPKWVGAMHGYEIEYVFGMPFSDQFTKLHYGFSADERILSDRMMTMWANFAKFGNPTPTALKYFDQNVIWSSYNTTNPSAFHFSLDKNTPFRTNAKSRQCRFWSKVLPVLIEEVNKVSKTSITIKMSWLLVTASLMFNQQSHGEGLVELLVLGVRIMVNY